MSAAAARARPCVLPVSESWLPVAALPAFTLRALRGRPSRRLPVCNCSTPACQRWRALAAGRARDGIGGFQSLLIELVSDVTPAVIRIPSLLTTHSVRLAFQFPPLDHYIQF